MYNINKADQFSVEPTDINNANRLSAEITEWAPAQHKQC